MAEAVTTAGVGYGIMAHNPRARRLRSKVWNDFSKEKRPDGSYVAICHHCQKQLTASSRSGTTHLKNHLTVCLSTGIRPSRGRRRKLVVRRVVIKEGDSNMGTNGTDSNLIGYEQNNSFDQDTSRYDLALMVIRHGYRFSIVDDQGFRTFISNLQPGFQIPVREVVQTDCMRIHDSNRATLLTSFLNLPARVSLSVDIWCSTVPTTGTEYLSLTCHYIVNEWKLKKKVLNFVPLDSACTGVEITGIILEKLREWGIEKKVLSVVLDNCSYSDEVGSELLTSLRANTNFEIFHVRSCSYILNLVIQEGLELVTDLTTRVRSSIRFVKSSQVRYMRFLEAVKQLGIGPEKPPFLSLDINTNPKSWGSMYAMLESVCRYQKAFVRLYEWDPEYRVHLSPDDWPVLSALNECLDVLYHTMEKLPNVENPTSNLYFNEICAIHLLLKEWCTNRYSLVASMAAQMLEKFERYWEVNKTVMAFASILDPRYKTKSMEYFFKVIYKDPYEAKERIESIQNGFVRLYNEYAAEAAGMLKNEPVFYKGSTGRAGTDCTDTGTGTSSFSRTTLFDAKRGLDQYLEETSTGQTVKSDLDLYLEEAVVRNNKEGGTGTGTGTDEVGLGFDVLGWWRVFEAKYPVLSVMARDLLSVPVSIVPLDNEARVLNDYLSAMDPVTVQGLICAQDWLRDDDEGTSKNLDGTSNNNNNANVPMITN